MSETRVGWGFDAHRFGSEPPVVLGGVVASTELGVEATSDGDIAVHAVIDALLGATALGDIGTFFPSGDAQWQGIDSFTMLSETFDRVIRAGWEPAFVDLTIIVQDVHIAPIRQAIRENLAEALGLELSEVSVKATTTDRMGFIGAGEGLAAAAIVTVRRA